VPFANPNARRGQAQRIYRQPQRYRWRVSQYRSKLEALGDVKAPDEASAIAKAIEQFEVTEPWRQRWLVAKRYA
jgi:hypothetical protein